jgi:hypothetical protein
MLGRLYVVMYFSNVRTLVIVFRKKINVNFENSEYELSWLKSLQELKNQVIKREKPIHLE